MTNVDTAGIFALGTSGTVASFGLAEINPWLAFTSASLTIVFMGIQIYRALKK